MVGIAGLLAQCNGTFEGCDLPRTLPWYFGLAFAAAWLAAVTGVVLLVRRRWLARRHERRDQEKRKRIEAARGTDVERW